jgi:hypothetical protein
MAPVAALKERSTSFGLGEIDVDQGVVVPVEHDMGRRCLRIFGGQIVTAFFLNVDGS